MADTQTEKAALRRRLRARLAALEPGYRAESDSGIARAVLALPAWQQAACVFMYISVGGEPDTRALLAEALRTGKRVCAPLTLGGGRMEARALADAQALVPARFGLLEPTPTAPLVPPEDIDLVIAPCVAADPDGYRLGNGGGYYDRYLPLVDCPVVCLCRGRLLQPQVPREPFDAPVSAVVTEEETYFTRK